MRKLVVICAVALLANPCPAGVITVDDDGPADYNNIQAAINAAGNGDTVVVLPGIYTGPGNRDIDFLGKAITVRSTDPNNPEVVAATIVDCNASYSDRHRGFYFHNQEGPDSVLNGLTVTRGFTTNSGGGIKCYRSSPTLLNCVLSQNWGIMWGGGMWNGESSPTLANCTFRANVGGGGGVYNTQSTFRADNCSFFDNADSGMRNDQSNVSLRNCIFRSNAFAMFYGCGGGILSGTSELNLVNCVFADNWAGRYGGALYMYGCDANIVNCTFIGNQAPQGSAIECLAGC